MTKQTDCGHPKYKRIAANREIAGLVFEYKTEQCTNCGATLWSSETEILFREWLRKQKAEHPDKFTIQDIKIPLDLYEFAVDFGKRHSVTETDVFRSAIAIFYTHQDAEMISNMKLPKFSQDFVTKKLRTNPVMYLRIETDARLLDLYKGEVVSEIIKRVLHLSQKGEEKMLAEMERLLFAA